MTDKPTNLRDQAASYLNSDAFKSLVPYLMSGGVGAIAGGAMSGRRRADSGESRVGYLGRILRNALIAGGLAGGAHYLGAKGLEKTVGNMSDSSTVLSGTPNDEGPLSTTVKNVAFSRRRASAPSSGLAPRTTTTSVCCRCCLARTLLGRTQRAQMKLPRPSALFRLSINRRPSSFAAWLVFHLPTSQKAAWANYWSAPDSRLRRRRVRKALCRPCDAVDWASWASRRRARSDAAR